MNWAKYFNPLNYFRYIFYQIYKNYYAIRIYLRKPFIVNINYDNENIRFSTTSHLELSRAKTSYTREPITVDWISNYIDDKDVVMDVGANIGAYSLLIAKLKKQSIVYSIEPESSNFYALNRNIVSNNLQERIIPLCIALGDKNTINSFNISQFESGAACHGLEAPVSEGIPFVPEHVQGIVGYRLDDLVNELRYQNINHIKVDVDGIEDCLMNGSKEFLNKNTCKTVLIEVYEQTLDSIEKTMKNCGFIEEKRDSLSRPSGMVYNILYKKCK